MRRLRRKRAAPGSGVKKYFEYRGVSHAVYAPIIQDDASNFVTGDVKDFTGVSEIGKSTESSSEIHHYDNVSAIIVDAIGKDTVSISASGIPLDVLADINGQYYDKETGLFVEQEGRSPFYAFGYITERTDGTQMYVWRLKGKFSVPDLASVSKDSGSAANGQSVTFTGVSTIYRFKTTGKPTKGLIVDASIADVSEEMFFRKVQTPDSKESVIIDSEGCAIIDDEGNELIAMERW